MGCVVVGVGAVKHKCCCCFCCCCLCHVKDKIIEFTVAVVAVVAVVKEYTQGGIIRLRQTQQCTRSPRRQGLLAKGLPQTALKLAT